MKNPPETPDWARLRRLQAAADADELSPADHWELAYLRLLAANLAGETAAPQAAPKAVTVAVESAAAGEGDAPPETGDPPAVAEDLQRRLAGILKSQQECRGKSLVRLRRQLRRSGEEVSIADLKRLLSALGYRCDARRAYRRTPETSVAPAPQVAQNAPTAAAMRRRFLRRVAHQLGLLAVTLALLGVLVTWWCWRGA